MRWRCPESDRLYCVLGPGHPGPHIGAVRWEGRTEFVTWSSIGPCPEPEPEMMPVEQIEPDSMAALVEVELGMVIAPEPPRYPKSKLYTTAHTRGFKGLRRTRENLDKMYAAPDEGIHISWDIHGHEILPLPTMDECAA